MLEARAAERRVVGEEEVAAPVALARDGLVGLRVDREEQAAGGGGLRYPAHDDERVPVRIGVDGAGAERRPA